ncbi:hypothetical protein UPYG_G00059850 [Umbra pygmaea]|uniref:GTPase IMAP family member 8 n=1 Tax=Umbra pygmaea TaxID=75934 RepID=A0ABD0XR07_UMBPY
MAASLSLRSSFPEEDLSCPVCCDIYRDPVLLSCSHSFCRDCLQHYWALRTQQDCPICRIRLPNSTTGPPRNLVLKNLCEAFVRERERRATEAVSDGWGLGGYCAAHGERLSLYCLEDRQPVCGVCQKSRQHNQHACCPLEDAQYQLNLAPTATEPEDRDTVESPGEFAGSLLSGGKVFWTQLFVGILFVILIIVCLYTRGSNTEQDTPLRLLLVGPTGQGRSSTGNTILGREAFWEDFSLSAVTTDCQSRTGPAAGKRPTGRSHITVIDTPGISVATEPGHNRASECAALAAPGPHAFLLVMRLGARFTEQEGETTVRWIQESFGEQSLKYTMVLFTGGDLLEGKPVKDFLKDNRPTKQLLSACGGRYHVFNNKERSDASQVTELLGKIWEMVDSNGGAHFTVDSTRPGKDEEAGSGVIVTLVVLVAVGGVFKLIVDDLWSNIQHSENR